MFSPFESKYKILEKIGEGSFSEVLKCEHRSSRTGYAAKRLKKIYKSEDGIANCPEFIAAQKVPYHPNLLNMLEYHYDSFYGRVIFIFELMDMSLFDYLKTKGKGLSEFKARNYLYQMLSGLEHLHKYGLFHRDIKPENVLIKFPSILDNRLSQVGPSETVKLADLGSIRGIFSEPPYTEYISTRWYRSPECLLTAGNYGPKMDVWAIGCVFYEMLTLKPLFPGCNEIDQLHKIHQVLGTPPIHYLHRLKSQSQNCVSFPKLKGFGTDMFLPFLTRNGRSVLRLMVEYDSEKRINVNRLLKNSYFDEFRHPPVVIKAQRPQPIPQGCKRSFGDDGSLPIYPHVKKKPTKRENYADELRRSKENSKSSLKSEKKQRNSLGATNDSKCNSSNRSSTKSLVDYNSSTQSDRRISFNIPTLPLVQYKVSKMDEPVRVTTTKHHKLPDTGKTVKSGGQKTFKSKSAVDKGINHVSFSSFTAKSYIISKPIQLSTKIVSETKNVCKLRKK